MDTAVGLGDAVRALRAELTAAIADAKGEELRFELGPVEMEFLLEVTTEASADAGVRFWVVSFGGKAGRTHGSTHRVKLTLDPVDPSGKRPRIAANVPTDPR